MPAGAFFSIATKRQRKKLNREGDIEVFRSRNGSLWVRIDGGYKRFKETYAPQQNGVVNLSWRGMSGGLLGSLAVLAKDEESATIGFTSEEAARIASYHVLTGAGRGRVIRDFFGISEEQKKEIVDIIRQGIKIVY